MKILKEKNLKYKVQIKKNKTITKQNRIVKIKISKKINDVNNKEINYREKDEFFTQKIK